VKRISVLPARKRNGAIGRRALAGLPLLLASSCSSARVSNAGSLNRLVACSFPYGDGPRRSLDVYAPPAEPDPQAPRPVVVFLYGGAWESGEKASCRFVGAALARLGFVVVIPDYRVYPEVTYPAFLEDCASALAWTRRNASHFGGGADAPFIMGHSAGAYNAAMLTLDARWLNQVGLCPRTDLRGMVGLAGPYDFLPFRNEKLRRIFAPGQPPRTTQPIAYVDGHNPPMLLLAGSRDSVVPPSNTLRLAARIREAGGPVEERIYPGVGHGEIIGAFAAPLRFLIPSLRDSVRFMHAPRQTIPL
jgi:acetyl esterase/lipase